MKVKDFVDISSSTINLLVQDVNTNERTFIKWYQVTPPDINDKELVGIVITDTLIRLVVK